MSSVRIKAIYNNFKDGESLTDDDVRVLHDHMKTTYDYTVHIPEFRLVANDAWNVYNRLADIIKARAERAELIKG